MPLSVPIPASETAEAVWAYATRLLTAAHAAALAEITAARLAQLDAGNMPGDIDTLLLRLTAGRAGFLDRIKDLTRPQASTQATTAALATVGSELTDTVPFTIHGYISLHNMQAGDTFLIIEEVRDQDDATWREYGRGTYTGVQESPMVWFEQKDLMGWRVRIQRTGGSDRNIAYQFFKERASA